MTTIEYTHVDVFADAPYSGNSLPVFVEPGELTTSQMLKKTQELRHFEAIFLWKNNNPLSWRARVFDLFNELPFAGHPVIGAAAVLHGRSAVTSTQSWQIELSGRTVAVETSPSSTGFVGIVDQGSPEYLGSFDVHRDAAYAFGLDVADIRSDLPLEVVSTGLRYLVIPVVDGALERARVTIDLTDLVTSVGAEFAVLLDESKLEMRHWNNDGVIEDVATGSAAGVVGAYRLRHGFAADAQEFSLHQGSYVGRPSTLKVRPMGTRERVRTVHVGGGVAVLGHGRIEAP